MASGVALFSPLALWERAGGEGPPAPKQHPSPHPSPRGRGSNDQCAAAIPPPVSVVARGGEGAAACDGPYACAANRAAGGHILYTPIASPVTAWRVQTWGVIRASYTADS